MAKRRKRSVGGWVFRIALYLVFLGALLLGALAAVYYAGIRLPVYSDVAAFALKNWNQTREVEVEADYQSSMVRRDERIHITVDLALPESVERLRAYMDGGRTMLLDCGPQKVFLHQLQNAELVVNDPDISLSGVVDLELEGLLDVREGRGVSAAVRMGFDRVSVWADVTSLKIEGLPDPMVEPILRQIARIRYTREQILDLAAGSLSPELAGLLATHRDALDLAFEDIIASQAGEILALQAVFSINEAAALGMIGEQLAEAGTARATRFAEALGPRQAAAQGLGQIGDLLDQLGGGAAREIIEEGLQGEGLKEIGDIANLLDGLTNCRTAF